MAEVIWLADALEDLDAIATFVEQTSPRRARLLVRRLIAATDRLRQFPHSGRPRVEDPLARDLVVPPFRIEYLVQASRVIIVAIKHGARDDGPKIVHESVSVYGFSVGSAGAPNPPFSIGP